MKTKTTSWRKWGYRFIAAFAATLILATAGLLTYQRFSDGPTGPLAGGPFKSGEEMGAPTGGWRSLAGDFEFELVGAGSSRTAGGLLLDDKLYITCDLGFIWNRLPEGTERNILSLIWRFKDWHERAQQDGRIRIRKDGKIYAANIKLVTDPDEIARLKAAMEALANEYFAPKGLGPRPQEAPNDVLFFAVT